MIKEIYEQKKYDDLSLKSHQFAQYLYSKYPGATKIDDKILLKEAKAFKIENRDVKDAINLMLRIGDAYITEDHIGIVK